MQRLDAATGGVITTYDQGVSLKVGTYKAGRGEYSRKGLVDVTGILDPDTIEILIRDDTVVQVYQDSVTKLNINTGKKLWDYKAQKGKFRKAALGRDDNVYLFECEDRWVDRDGSRHPHPGIAVISLDGKTGKERWDFKFDNKVVFPAEFSGAADGYLVFTVYWLPDGERFRRMGTNYKYLLDADTGTLVREGKDGSVRRKTFMLDGELFATHSYKTFTFSDPISGNASRQCNVYGQPGGCGLPTFTPEYIIRGQMFHLRNDPQVAFASSGFRPHCESPMMPGYGALYSGQSGTCGCAWYLPTAYVKADTHREQPEVQQRTTHPASTVSTSMGVPNGRVSKVWPVTHYMVGGTKSERSSHIPSPAKEYIKEAITKKKQVQWYGFGPAPELKQNGVTYKVDVHHQRISATQGDATKWTAVLDGRISHAPIIVGKMLIAATHAGAIYGLDPETGKTKWRTLVAPNDQQLVAFGQLESLWPCYGVVEHDGSVLTIAGRISSLDTGFYAASINPENGAINWRVKQAVDPVQFKNVAKQIPGGRGWGTKRGNHAGQPFSRGYQSLNTPPMITNGHLHAAGMLMVNIKDPKDFSFGYSDSHITKLPDLPAAK